VAAAVGTYYTDTAATNGAIRWVKASGTGNVGWRVIFGDTGWRTLTSWTTGGVITGAPLQAAVAPRAGFSGSIGIRRVGYTAYIRVSQLQAGTAGLASNQPIIATANLPVGFFSVDYAAPFVPNSGTDAFTLNGLRISSAGLVSWGIIGTASLPANFLLSTTSNQMAAFPCEANLAWPPTLP